MLAAFALASGAQSLSDRQAADMEAPLLTMEMGTVACISNSPGGYIDGLFWNIFQLEDGTRIAAKVNGSAVTSRDDPVDSLMRTAVLPVGTAVLPVGTAVLPVGTPAREDLTAEQPEVPDQYRGITVNDCYIDMEGAPSSARRTLPSAWAWASFSRSSFSPV